MEMLPEKGRGDNRKEKKTEIFQETNPIKCSKK